MKKGLRHRAIRGGHKTGFHACPDEEGITTALKCAKQSAASVFTRALMKKGLRLLRVGGRIAVILVFTRALMKKGLRLGSWTGRYSRARRFHACPDEEGITTRIEGRPRQPSCFHACPDEEGITTRPSRRNEP